MPCDRQRPRERGHPRMAAMAQAAPVGVEGRFILCSAISLAATKSRVKVHPLWQRWPGRTGRVRGKGSSSNGSNGLGSSGTNGPAVVDPRLHRLHQ